MIFAVGLQLVPIVLLTERKLLGRFQNRYGPNRVGPFGALQPLADILKLLDQGAVPPAHVGRLAVRARADDLDPHRGRARSRSSRSATRPGHLRHAGRASTASTSSIGPLYVFAFGAIAFYGLMLGGWASGSKYSFLGAMRAAAQLISYEVAQGLALVGVIITAQTLSLTGIVERAGGHVVLHPAVRRLPDLHGRRASPRPTARRSTSPRPTPSWSAATTPSTAAARFASYYFAEYLNVIVVSGIADDAVPRRLAAAVRDRPAGWVDPFVVLGEDADLRRSSSSGSARRCRACATTS